MNLSSFKNLLKESKHILIAAHVNPDGDAIGAMTAMGHLCEALEVPYTILMEEPIKKFHYLTEKCQVASTYESYFDKFISVDCGELTRLGIYQEYAKKSPITICIDHHITNQQFADYNYIEPTASSSSELVYNIVKACEVPITLEMGLSIYTGIVTDTGGFMHSCTNPSTHQAAAELISLPFDFPRIYQSLIHQRTLASTYLQMEVVKHLEKIEDKIYLSYLTPEDLTKHCASKEDIDGVVNYLKNIEGAEIVGLLYPSQYGYKLSLRSNAPYNVAEVCQTFGGGGHKYAAGATFAGDLENIYHMVKAALLKLLS